MIAGRGSGGREIAEQRQEHGLAADYRLAPCGGGGRRAGVATAMAALGPEAAIYGVEPEHYDDHRRSLQAGRRVRLDNPPPTRCDALAASIPGEITWPINQSRATGFLTASEEETAQAIRAAFHNLKLVLEPGGAVALAAALREKLPIRGKTVAVIASGGNIDPQIFTQLLQETPA